MILILKDLFFKMYIWYVRNFKLCYLTYIGDTYKLYLILPHFKALTLNTNDI